MEIWKARYDSINFSFEAYGMSYAHARKVMVKTLNQHTEEYALLPDWYYPEDIICNEVKVGCGYRDGEVIVKEEVKK